MPELEKTGILSLNLKRIYNALSLEYNSRIAVGELIFHYTNNPSANLKGKYTYIWQYYLQLLFKQCTYNNFRRQYFIQKFFQTFVNDVKNIIYFAIIHLALTIFILANNSNDFKVTLMKSLLINRDHSSLNKNRHFLPLELFND